MLKKKLTIGYSPHDTGTAPHLNTMNALDENKLNTAIEEATGHTVDDCATGHNITC